MAIKSVAVLKTFFETGDRPTESQFSDLIDSFLHKNSGVAVSSYSYDSGTGEFSITFSDGGSITFSTAGSDSEEISFINGLQEALDSKVDKEVGKGLSTNDFTNALKTKLDGLTQVVLPTEVPISYVTGLQAALDAKANDSEVVKSVNNVAPDAAGNVNIAGGSDYSEGDWDVTVITDSGETLVPQIVLGEWAKVGKKVRAQARFFNIPAAVDNSGTFKLGGLPFPANARMNGGFVMQSENIAPNLVDSFVSASGEEVDFRLKATGDQVQNVVFSTFNELKIIIEYFTEQADPTEPPATEGIGVDEIGVSAIGLD